MVSMVSMRTYRQDDSNRDRDMVNRPAPATTAIPAPPAPVEQAEQDKPKKPKKPTKEKAAP